MATDNPKERPSISDIVGWIMFFWGFLFITNYLATGEILLIDFHEKIRQALRGTFIFYYLYMLFSVLIVANLTIISMFFAVAMPFIILFNFVKGLSK